MPKVRVTPIIGLPQFNGWSQVVESPPHSSVKTVLSVAIEGNQAGNIGRDIANYFSSQVVQTLEEFHILLEEIIDQATENESRILCSAGFFSGDDCAYATFNGAVLLKRADKIGTILSSGNQLKLITGHVGLQDVVIFSTLPSARFFSEIEIKFTQGYDVDTIVTSVVPGLHAEANSSLSSLAFVTFSKAVSTVGSNDSEFPDAVVVQDFQSRQERPQQSTNKLWFSPQSTKTNAAESIQTDDEISESHAPLQRSSIEVDETVSPRNGTTESEEKHPAEESVVGTLTASLEDPIVPAAQQRDFGALATAGISAFGSLISQLLKGIQTFVRILGPKLKYGLQESKNLFRKLAAAVSKRKDVSTPAQDGTSQTGKTFRNLLPNSDVYIETANSKRVRNIRLLVVGVSIALLAALLFFVVTSKRNAEREAATSLLQPYIERVAAAEELAKIDPVTARDEVQNVLREVENVQAEYDQNSLTYEILSSEREKIQELYTAISGLDALQELPIFYDLRLVSSDFIASKVLMHEDILYFFDIEQKTAISLDRQTKQAAKREIPVDSFIDVSLLAEDSLILTTEGIGRATFLEDSLEYSEAIAAGDSNRSATLLATYDPYVYVVNPEKRNIYRYAQSEDSFSDPIGWIQEIARGLDFATISSIAIDGDVWLGTKDGSIYKFTRGRVQDFEIRGLQKPFESTVLVHTSDTVDRLYILEAQNNRIVILQKNGDFIKEISNTSLGSVTDIVVNSDGTYLYAISGSVVFELAI